MDRGRGPTVLGQSHSAHNLPNHQYTSQSSGRAFYPIRSSETVATSREGVSFIWHTEQGVMKLVECDVTRPVLHARVLCDRPLAQFLVTSLVSVIPVSLPFATLYVTEATLFFNVILSILCMRTLVFCCGALHSVEP